MGEVTEQERGIDEGRGLGKGRHVCRGDDAVVDGLALRHVFEILLFKTQRRVLVQHEADGLAVVLLHQLFKLGERPGEGVVVVELHGTVERNWRLRPEDARKARCCGKCSQAGEDRSTLHGCCFLLTASRATRIENSLLFSVYYLDRIEP